MCCPRFRRQSWVPGGSLEGLVFFGTAGFQFDQGRRNLSARNLRDQRKARARSFSFLIQQKSFGEEKNTLSGVDFLLFQGAQALFGFAGTRADPRFGNLKIQPNAADVHGRAGMTPTGDYGKHLEADLDSRHTLTWQPTPVCEGWESVSRPIRNLTDAATRTFQQYKRRLPGRRAMVWRGFFWVRIMKNPGRFFLSGTVDAPGPGKRPGRPADRQGKGGGFFAIKTVERPKIDFSIGEFGKNHFPAIFPLRDVGYRSGGPRPWAIAGVGDGRHVSRVPAIFSNAGLSQDGGGRFLLFLEKKTISRSNP